MPRKRLKQLPAPETYNSAQIEAWASHVGNEVHFDQRRIIVTRKIAEYVPCPKPVPVSGGRRITMIWSTPRCGLQTINGITASMLRALQAIEFSTTSAIQKLASARAW